MEGAASIFDAYELRARYFPAVLLSVPLLTVLHLTLASAFPGIADLFEKAAVTLAVIYVISLYVRYAGRRIQPRLWAAWHGAPSTRLARWRDPEIPLLQKKAIHVAVESAFGIQLATSDQEEKDKGGADSLVSQAFERVRAYLRTSDTSGLVAKQNAEYGCLRNLLAVRETLTVESVLCLAVAIILWAMTRRATYGGCAAAEFAYAVSSLVIGWRVLPKMTRLAADTYARNAWLTFVEIASRPRA